MALAFVLVTAEPGMGPEVRERLRQVPEVRELTPLSGEYDLICKVDAPDFDALGQAIHARIRSIPGVSQTRTMTTTRF